MTLSGQLYRLQELDLDIEAKNNDVERAQRQLADNSAVAAANSRLEQSRASLDAIKHRQTELEWQSADLGSKMEKLREKLFSGRISNSKELSGLKQDFDLLQTERRKVDDEILVLMEQAETAGAGVTTATQELKAVEGSTQEERRALGAALERTNEALARLVQERQSLVVGIESEMLTLYQQLRRQKGHAVVKVEQGICRGCGIALSPAWMKKARAGEFIRCTSCSRILYLE